jgi:hypothetical protein
MADAKYSMMIPEVDNFGNQLTDVSAIAHGALQGITEGSFTTPGQMGRWQDGDPEPHSTFTVIIEDNPMHDSIFKEAAQKIGTLTNQEAILAYKEGKNGIQKWVLYNPNYQEDAPADPSVLLAPPRVSKRAFPLIESSDEIPETRPFRAFRPVQP